ncbi:MAG: Flp family type IVb pilin [Alphaproteobacteria bacterium]|nr:Flp family type IVb pilin [Alphaproteobacteria bacterium]
MKNIIAKIHAFVASEEGATAIEYGLIAAGISLAIVAAVFAFGDELQTVFGTMEDKMAEAADRVEGGGEGG